MRYSLPARLSHPTRAVRRRSLTLFAAGIAATATAVALVLTPVSATAAPSGPPPVATALAVAATPEVAAPTPVATAPATPIPTATATDSAAPPPAPVPIPAAASSAPSAASASIHPVHPPVVSGAVRAGATLTARTGTWSVTPTSLTYQWFAGDTAIAGAVLAQYIVAGSDVGQTLSVAVTAGAPGLTPATARSAPTRPVTTGILSAAAPAVNGGARVGNELTGVPGLWNPPGVTFTYQWLRASVAIPGATSKTYALTDADLGTRISVAVTGSAVGFASTTRQSLRSDLVVVADAPEPSAAGRISGTLSGGVAGNYITDGSLFLFPAGHPEPVDASGTYNNGRFTYTGIAPGEYTLYASATWNGITSNSYYGGGHDLDSAATFVVRANGSTEVTFVIERGGTINGRVTAPAGQKVEASAVVLNSDGSELTRSPVAADGTYSVQSIPVGTYRLFVETADTSTLAGSFYRSGSSPLTATPITIAQRNQVVTGINVVLSVGGSVSGAVRSGVTGKLVNEVEVRAYLADDSSNTVLRTTGVLQGDGTFSFTGLPAGRFTLRVDTSFSSEQDLASIWVGGTNRATATIFTSVPGTATPFQNIVLKKGAAITVSVVAGSPAVPFTDGYITLTRVGADASETRQQGGSSPWTFNGLTPGTYRVAYTSYDSAYGNVVVPAPVVVTAGDNPTITIVLTPAGG